MAHKATMEDLDKQLKECILCPLNLNCHKVPDKSIKSKYVMLTEYPYRGEPEFMQEFWRLAGQHGFKREDFVQLSTVQCYPDSSKRNGVQRYVRPSVRQREFCRKWFEAYVLEFNPSKIISFGNIPMEHLIGEFSGISDKHGKIERVRIGKKIYPVLLSVSPSVLRTGQMGKDQMRKALSTFRDM